MMGSIFQGLKRPSYSIVSQQSGIPISTVRRAYRQESTLSFNHAKALAACCLGTELSALKVLMELEFYREPAQARLVLLERRPGSEEVQPIQEQPPNLFCEERYMDLIFANYPEGSRQEVREKWGEMGERRLDELISMGVLKEDDEGRIHVNDFSHFGTQDTMSLIAAHAKHYSTLPDRVNTSFWILTALSEEQVGRVFRELEAVIATVVAEDAKAQNKTPPGKRMSCLFGIYGVHL
jgi:hypothetical protein